MGTVKIIMEYYANQQRETKNKIDPKLVYEASIESHKNHTITKSNQKATGTIDYSSINNTRGDVIYKTNDKTRPSYDE